MGINALMALCDALESRLKERSTVQGKLAEAVGKGIANGSSGPSPANGVKAGQGLSGCRIKKPAMNIIALLYAEFLRLKEELKRSPALIKWDEKTHRYYASLKKMFSGRE